MNGDDWRAVRFLWGILLAVVAIFAAGYVIGLFLPILNTSGVLP